MTEDSNSEPSEASTVNHGKALCIILKLPDAIAISAVLDRFFYTKNPENATSKICDIEYISNPAGYFGTFGYEDRDFRTENFWSRDQSRVRRFSAILTINNITESQGIYGLHLTFFDDRPFGTELFSMGTDVPDEFEKVEIISLCEM